MADEREPMVKVPAALLATLTARLEVLEAAQRSQTEALLNPRANIIDKAYQDWKAEASRPANVRTQDMVDARYGTAAPRFVCKLDGSTEDGKPGPNLSEWFSLTISANSDLEAKARYEDAMGIKSHPYKIVTQTAEAAAFLNAA